METTTNWLPIASAPKTATWVMVRLKDGTIHRAHWASDLSGEEQPPFQGWFIQRGEGRGSYMSEIPEPLEWMDEAIYNRVFGGAVYGPK